MSITIMNAYPSPSPLSPQNIDVFYTTMRTLQSKAQQNRILILPYFLDFDKQHTCTVTIAQFARVLTIVGLPVSQSALNVLCHIFQSSKDPSRINYRPFLAELSRECTNNDKYEETKETSNENEFTPVTTTTHHTTFTNVEDLIRDLQIYLREYRNILSISEPFEDFDKLRHSRITATQFRRCLNIFGYPFTNSDITLLIQRYNADNNEIVTQTDRAVIYVCYRKFLGDLLAGFVPTFEALATATLDSTKPSTLRFNKERKSLLSPEEMVDTERLIEELAYICSTHQIAVKAHFVPYDTKHHGRITERQFCSVLTAMFPMYLSPQAMKFVSIYFSDSEDEVNYVTFCQAIQQMEKNYQEAIKNSFVEAPESNTIGNTANWVSRNEPKSFFISTAPVSQTNVDQLLESMRRTISSHRLNLDEIFVNFDTLRKGTVNASRFRRCMFASGIRLTETELSLLASYYGSDEGFVNYKNLLSDLSEIPKI